MNAVITAVRNLARARGFSALVVVTLALGIGATTAMFSVVDAVLINRLPFPNADRVIEVWINYEEGASRQPAIMNQIVAAVRGQHDLFDAVGGYAFESGTLTGFGEPEMLSLVSLAPSSFALLPTAPLAGRLFVDSDAASVERALLISERLWIGRFGRDPGVVGRVVTIDDQPNRIIGVLPSRFVFPDSDRDGWRPIDIDANERTRVMIVAQRKAGVTRQVLDARLESLTISLRDSGALPPGQFLVTEEPLQFTGVARSAGNSLYLLLGAAVVLLLVACVNVTNLFLVRGSARQAELALRASLGAGRFQLMRDAAGESLLLAAAGGVGGLWMAKAALDTLLLLAPGPIQSAARYTGALDPRAVFFAMVVTLVTCLFWSLLPAWRASRVDAIEALQSARSTTVRRDAWWQGALVSTQIALVVVLLAGAGLLLRSFVALNQVDLGFNAEPMVSIELRLTQPRYAAPGAALSFVREIEARVEQELGAPATIGASPIRMGGYPDARPEVEGAAPAEMTYLPFSRVSPDFFDVYGIPIVDGRTFTHADGSDAVVINDLMASRYFGGGSPVGRRIRWDATQPWLTVIGVARDVQALAPGDSRSNGMEYYIGFPPTPQTFNFLSLSAVTRGEPSAAVARIKQIVWQLDPQLPILSAMPLRAQVADAISRPRFVLSLSSAFAICAILVAAVGVYGVSAYWVARRRRELAIRIAVGASPGRLIQAVLLRSVRYAAIGIVAGLIMAMAGARVLQSFLFATDPRDPMTLGVVAVLLALTAVASTVVPAIKAARVDPMATLRAE